MARAEQGPRAVSRRRPLAGRATIGRIVAPVLALVLATGLPAGPAVGQAPGRTVSPTAGRPAAADQARPEGCWVRGSRADLGKRLSPLDSTSVMLRSGPVKVCYGRPSRRDRTIMGGLVPYGTPWRLGANEATSIRMPAAGSVGGVAVDAGWYSLYAVPGRDEWQVVVNGSARRWGIPIDDSVRAKDVGTDRVTPARTDSMVEQLTLEFQKTAPDAADLIVRWERTVLRVPIALGAARQSTSGGR